MTRETFQSLKPHAEVLLTEARRICKEKNPNATEDQLTKIAFSFSTEALARLSNLSPNDMMTTLIQYLQFLDAVSAGLKDKGKPE